MFDTTETVNPNFTPIRTLYSTNFDPEYQKPSEDILIPTQLTYHPTPASLILLTTKRQLLLSAPTDIVSMTKYQH